MNKGGRRIHEVEGYEYVYILDSLREPERHYVGRCVDLKKRLQRHNRGAVPSTARLRPWRIRTAIAFSDRDRAVAFERYLKSGSGRAFAGKRL